MENHVQHEVCPPHRQPGVETSYTDFLAMHPPTFAKATDPLEVDNWLRIIKSKFGLLYWTEIQKTLFVAQKLHGPTSAWWANFTATIQDSHQVPWAEFRTAFCGTTSPWAWWLASFRSCCTYSRVQAVCTSTARS
jgi:hypothetical protein